MYRLFSFIIVLLLFTQCKETKTTSETVTEKVAEVVDKSVEETKEAIQTIEDSAKVKAAAMLASATAEKEKIKEAVTKEVEPVKEKEKVIPKKKKKRSKIKFEETTFKFGTIKTGDKVNHKFKFKNTGNAPLVIKNVDVSCGCTFPSYPFLPIKPGEAGEIDVTFNSEHKVGRQKPTVTVVTNGRPRTLKLYLEGFVE